MKGQRKIRGPWLSGLAGATVAGLVGASAVRLVGFVRQVVTARAFGLEAELDAFLLAALLPTMVGGVLGSAIGTSLVPRLSNRSGTPGDPEIGRRFWLAVSYASLLGLVVYVVLWMLAEPISSVLASDTDPAYKLTLKTTTRILAVVPMFVILYEVVAAGLVSKSRFTTASALPIFTPLAVALAVIGGVRTAVGLAVATVVGSLIIASVGLLLAALQFRSDEPTVGSHISGLRTFARGTIAFTTAMFLSQASIFIDKLMASSLESGSVSALEFGSRVPEAVIGIAAVGLANAVAQRSGRPDTQAERAALTQTTRSLGRWILGLGTVATLVLILFSRRLVEWIFVGQSFTSADADIVIEVQIAYLIQIPFYLMSVTAVRVLAAVGRAKWVTIGTLFHLLLSVTGNLLLMRAFGVAGIALATSLAFVVTGSTLWYAAHRSVRTPPGV